MRRIYVTVLLLVLVNLLTTLPVAIATDKTFSDALKFYQTAQNLYEGRGFSRDYKDDVHIPLVTPPFPAEGRFLFSYVVSRSFLLFGESIQTGNGVAAVCKALLVIPIFGLALELFGFSAALAAGLLFTFNPFYYEMGLRTMPETFSSLLYYLALYMLVLYVRKPRQSLLLFAGLAVSLAYLTRPETLLLLLFGVVLIWFAGPHRSALVTFLALPLLTLSLGSYMIYGRPFALDPTPTSLATLPTWWDFYSLQRSDWTHYLNAVGGVWGAVQIRIYNLLRFTKNVFSDGLLIDTQVGLLPVIFLPLLLLPLLIPQSSRRPRMLRFMATFILFQGVVTLAYPGYPGLSTEVRHGQIIAPFMMVLAGGGLAYLITVARDGVGAAQRLARLASGALIGVYSIFSLIFFSGLLNFYLWTPPYRGGVEDGAAWAQNELPANSVILSRRPADAYYYAARPIILAPTAEFTDLMDYARQNHVTHLLITDFERQALPNLLDGIDLYAGHFRRIHTAATFSLVEITNPDFGPEKLGVPGDAYISQGQAASRRLSWSDLGDLRPQHSLESAASAWRDFLERVRHGALNISQQFARQRHIQHEARFSLGQAVTLKGYDLGSTLPGPGKTVHLTLYWQSTKPITGSYTVFVHVLGPDGRVYGQADSQPLHGAYPTSRWAPGEIVQDDYVVSTPGDSPPGRYQFEVGMYLVETGKRLAVTDASGQPVEQDRILLDPGP
jgi:hypothetical protein